MNNLTEKSIGELIKYNFFIPSYQRGYRWTEIQVEDLLNDIWEFIEKPRKKDNEWYCLQPVVVKNKTDFFEVLDGQQRLTTIFLILKHLERFVESERKSFEIEFETRNTENSNSKEFLENISDKSEHDAIENIDYFHIYHAYQKISNWFKSKANEGFSSISSKFITPFLESTKVIWYEVPTEKDAIEIFTRINMGKIPLTNAELIKALFLNSSNFPNCDSEKLKLKQFEIASEWDRIEYSLQNKEFWYFINKAKNVLPTRIEFIFNLMKDIEGVKNGNDQYSTFRFFSDKFKTKSQDEIDNNWTEIKRLFQTIQEWFIDRELYHKTGYLITTGTEIKDLIIDAKSKTKKEFKQHLNKEISGKVKCDNIEVLEYGKHNAKISNILLYHNIQSILNSSDELSRFPFSKFKNKKNGWSLEHIHAQNSKEITEYEDFKDWYNAIDGILISSEIKIRVKKLEKIDDKSNDIPKLIEEITNLFGDIDIHTIDNLALLSKTDNSALNNSIFPKKREKIIELEKTGSFIPICTKNVFQKYFDGCTKHVSKWEEDDREAYLNDIKTTVYSKQN